MNKLILTILLLAGLTTNAHASIMSDIQLFNTSGDDYYSRCQEDSMACAWPEEKMIFINTDIVNTRSLYLYAYYHEVCHIIIRPYWPKYRGDDEEYVCDLFSLWVLTGIDYGKGAFQNMVINASL